MRKTTRLLSLSILAALTLSLATPLDASAGSDQSCSQRGGKNNSVLCVLNIGPVTVNVIGDRALWDNEINAIVTLVNTDLSLDICSATDRKSESSCGTVILDHVIDLSESFTNFQLFKACVAKGRGANQCRTQSR